MLQVIWEELAKAFTPDYFNEIIEDEYGAVFAARSKQEIEEHVEKIREQYDQKVLQFIKSTRRHVDDLKDQIRIREDKITKLTSQKIKDDRKARDEALQAANEMFKVKEA